METIEIIPARERRRIRNNKIKALYKMGYSMNEVCKVMADSGQGVSKTTVFFALNGRSKKNMEATKKRKRKKKEFLKIINQNNPTT